MKDVQPVASADKQEAVVMYKAKRRFRGLWVPVIVAAQVSLVYFTMAALNTQIAVAAAVSALGWCVYSLFLDDTAVKLFNTKEYFRVLLNEATLTIHEAESKGFILENISEEPGTPDGNTSLIKEKEASDAKENDVDGNK